MATPIPDSQFPTILRAEGCHVREVPGWRTHNRGNRGTGWGPINGVLCHHTGSDTSGDGQSYNRNILWSGYTGLPGPLCHGGLAPDGTLWLNSNGRANHAGLGCRQVLDDVIREASWLMQREANPRTRETDGNSRLYGLEIMYSGSHTMTVQQWDQAVRFAAAICRFYGWSARSVIGHREWSYTKVDPGHCSMVTFRRAVQHQLDHAPAAGGAGGAGGGGPAPLKPNPVKPKEWDEMASKQDIQDAVGQVVHDQIAGFLEGIPAPDRVDDKTWGLWFYLKNIDARAYNAGRYAWIAAYGQSDQIADKVAAKVGTGTDVKAAVKEAISELASAEAQIDVKIGGDEA